MRRSWSNRRPREPPARPGISQINAGIERGRDPGQTITYRPYDLLRAIGRGTGGKDYAALKAAIGRLRDTRIETTNPAPPEGPKRRF
jgi:plasmid replication initiation protein